MELTYPVIGATSNTTSQGGAQFLSKCLVLVTPKPGHTSSKVVASFTASLYYVWGGKLYFMRQALKKIFILTLGY